jgi:hypothetical protein
MRALPTLLAASRTAYRGERDCAERRGGVRGYTPGWPSTVDAILLEREIADPAHAALGVEELRRRVDLEWSTVSARVTLLRLCVGLRKAIDRMEAGAAGRTARIRSGRQLDRTMPPLDARDRQVAVRERMRDRDVGPRQPVAAVLMNGLDRVAALADFERAVLGQHALFDVAVDADDRPVDLLVEIRAWIAARAVPAWRASG